MQMLTSHSVNVSSEKFSKELEEWTIWQDERPRIGPRRFLARNIFGILEQRVTGKRVIALSITRSASKIKLIIINLSRNYPVISNHAVNIQQEQLRLKWLSIIINSQIINRIKR